MVSDEGGRDGRSAELAITVTWPRRATDAGHSRPMGGGLTSRVCAEEDRLIYVQWRAYAMNVPLTICRAFRFTAVLALAGAMVGAAPSEATAATCVSWAGTQPVNPSSSGDALRSVAVLSPCNAWAVGSQQTGTSGAVSQTLAEHWNGAAWNLAPSSNPAGSSHDAEFSGVAATSSSNAWAVGDYTPSTAAQTLIERQSNGIWEQLSSPDPGGSMKDNFLAGVATTSAKNAWAVGSYFTKSGEDTLITHWNGKTWSLVPSPNPSATENLLTGVTATSAKNAWAVGYQFDAQDTEKTLIEHWDGTSWKVVASPDPGPLGNVLASVAASSASSAWAVGDYFAKGSIAQTLIVRWNGKTWKRVVVPSLDRESVPGGLQGVTVVSAKDAWAVGSYTDVGTRTLITHWNGKTWTRVPSPNLGDLSHLKGVAASAPGNVWAVGDYFPPGDIDFTFAVHCC
jgi:hypothetical protein